MRKLIFFIGPAGSGKTTIAKALARRRSAALFDMDTLLRPAAEALMAMSGLDPQDRDSLTYKKHCRDLGYRITMDAALENVELESNAFVIGPFTQEISDRLWLEHELARIGASLDNVNVKAVLVHLSDTERYHQRIQARASSLDRWKLDNWDEFSQSLVVREIKWNLPASSILYFDNSLSLAEAHLLSLERFIYGSKSRYGD